MGVSLGRYLKDGGDATSVHVFMEDIAGLGCALIALGSVLGGYLYNPVTNFFQFYHTFTK